SDRVLRRSSRCCPPACHESIAGVSVDELSIGDALGVGVAEIDQTGRLPMQTDRVLAVPVEVADEWLVTGVPEDVGELRGAEPTAVLAQLVDDVEALLGRAVDRDRVTSVPVEVAGDGDVTGVSEEERDVGNSLRVR